MRHIHTSFGDVAYLRRGTGPALILLTGWGVHPVHYRRLMSGLQAEYCCYVIAWPSFGSARLAAAWGLDNYALWLEEVLAAIRVNEPIMIIAHSFGAGVALKFSARTKLHIRQLVLINPIGIPFVRKLRRWSWYMLRAFIREIFAQSILPHTWRRRLLASRILCYISIKHWHSLVGRRTLWNTMHRFLSEDLSSTARQVIVPTIIVSGANDQLIPTSVAQTIAQLMPHATYIPVEKAGHDLCNFEPERFIEILRPYLLRP